MSVNKVIVLGRLGQDPDLRYTAGGSPVCNFSLATSESWTDKSGQKQEKTEWHRVVVWGKLGELCNQYLSKGRQAYVEGKLSTRAWEDKEGNKRYTTEVQASTVQFIGAAQSAGAGASNNYDNAPSQNSGSAPAPAGDMMDKNYSIATDTNFTADDIPF